MGYLRTALEVMMALFAVIGVYCMARLLAQRLFGSRRLLLAVEILNEQALPESEEAIRDALSQFLLVPSGRICVLTTSALAEDAHLRALVAKYGVSLFVLEETKK